MNSEKTFGLQGHLGKRVWFMTEVKRNLNFSQADFQSMVSGEHVSVAEKFRTATTEKWKAPGLLCGNECPGWFDSAGSLQRRIIVFPFRRRVHDKDARPNLTRSIKSQELGALLFKCAYAYLEAAYLKPNVSIWDMLPRFFSQEAMVMQSETDAVSAVLLDTKYELWQKVPLDQRGPRDQYWMLWSDFAKDVEYRSKVLRRSHFGETLTEDRWSSTFQKLELTVDGIPGSEDPEHPCLIKGIRIRRHQAPERTT
ncbi:hypothetical protein EBZ37_08460 [bacterium]|nr:hypothetical protein [bacterium]